MKERFAPALAALCVLACGEEAGVPAASTLPAPIACDACRVIRHVRVVDADGARDDRRILVQGANILAEEPDDARLVEGAIEEIDGRNLTVIPGLWDVHVHVQVNGEGPTSSGDFVEEHLSGYLYSGITSVVDTGASRTLIFPLRESARAGAVVSPTLRAVGPAFTVAGGHPCTNFSDPSSCLIVEDAASVEPLMQGLAVDEPDLVKLVIDDGPTPWLQMPRMTAEQAIAVVAAADARGLRALAHVSSSIDARDAVAAGSAALAHMPGEDDLGDALTADIVARGVHVMTTLAVYEASHHYVTEPAYLDDPLVVGAVPAAVLASLKSAATKNFFASAQGQAYVDATFAFFQRAMANTARLRNAGALLIAGSDAGNFMTFHGPGLHRELELLVQAGLTPTEAITAATLTPARFFGVDGEIGRIATGYRADLLLVRGDPSADIRATQQIEAVWRSGEPLNRDALRPR